MAFINFKAPYYYHYQLNMHDDEAVSCIQVMYEYESLENFWKRYNRVLLDRVALDKEKSDLLHENQQLRTLLKQYLDGISVNDEILNQVNPLFVVNHRTNVNIRWSISRFYLFVVANYTALILLIIHPVHVNVNFFLLECS